MEYYTGIDVSLKESSVCIVDAKGKIVREVKVASEPETLVRYFDELELPDRAGGGAAIAVVACRSGLGKAGFPGSWSVLQRGRDIPQEAQPITGAAISGSAATLYRCDGGTCQRSFLGAGYQRAGARGSFNPADLRKAICEVMVR